MMSKTWWLSALCLCAVAQTASAQSIWRCGPDGTRFQAVPCHDGQTVSVKPAPDATAVQEARDVAQRERLALQALGDERRQRERDAMARGLGPSGIQPLPRPDPPKVRKAKEKPRTATPWTTPAALSTVPAQAPRPAG